MCHITFSGVLMYWDVNLKNKQKKHALLTSVNYSYCKYCMIGDKLHVYTKSKQFTNIPQENKKITLIFGCIAHFPLKELRK